MVMAIARRYDEKVGSKETCSAARLTTYLATGFIPSEMTMRMTWVLGWPVSSHN